MPRPISRSKQALFIGVTLALVAGSAEIGLRLLGAAGVPPFEALREFDPSKMKIEPLGDHGYRQRASWTYEYGNGAWASSNAMSYRGPEVKPPRTGDELRIVLIGGSTTHGFGVLDDQTIDWHMREILGERFPGLDVQVINLGMDGYDSYQVYERMLSDGVRFKPDVVIIHSGINDVRNAQFEQLDIPGPDPRTLIWEDHLARARAERARGGPTLWSRAKHLSLLLRLPGFIRKQLGQRERVERIENVAPHPEAVDYFEANIHRATRIALEHDAAVILSTPPSALDQFDASSLSYRGYWIVDAATTEAYRRLLAARLEEIANAFSIAGADVSYIAAEVAPDMFLDDDDCHLDDRGNRALAEAFADAIARHFTPPSSETGG